MVGQVSKLENKYETRNNIKAKQKGKSLAFSVELGKNYKISNNLFIEPQVQGIYQYLKLNDFSDGTRNVKIDDKGIWRSRIGLRFSNNIPQSESLSFYGLLNLWNDFGNSSKVKANIGKDKIKEKYSSTYAEIGVGLDVPLLNTLNIYADFKYQKDLKKKNNSYSGSFGIKYSL